MAIDINEFTLPWKPAEACDYIQSQTDNFGVFFDVDRCFELSGILQMENAKISRKCRHQRKHQSYLSGIGYSHKPQQVSKVM